METVEILIYMSITLIIGSLLIGFIIGFDVGGIYTALKGGISPDEQPRFEKITLEEFPKKLFIFMDICESTDQNRSVTYYLSGEGTLQKSDIFDVVKSLDWCNNIQSKENSCGTREDLIFNSTKTLPDIIELRCFDDRLVLS